LLIGLGLIGVVAGMVFLAWPRGNKEEDIEATARLDFGSVHSCRGASLEREKEPAAR
jgi:hypothetical protein